MSSAADLDLAAASGLPECRMYAGPGAALPSLDLGPSVDADAATEARTAADLTAVLRDPASARPDDPLYRVWRGVAPREAADDIARRGLSFAVLVMRAGCVAGSAELCRTRGHTNPPAPGTTLAYPEVHEVWHGDALLYLQSAAAPEPGDVVVMPLTAGDRAVVAPGWASLLVNVGDGPLAVGTFRMADCAPEHAALSALGGMAHRALRADFRPYTLEPNPRYTYVPEPRRLSPRDLPDWGLTHGGAPLLTAFRRNPDFLRFLLRPQDYADVWATLYADEAAAV
jgi:glucose-6-phosphate isomerase